MDWKEAGVPQPLSTSIDLTEGCNLACEYCFTQSCHTARHITWDMAQRIIDWWLPQTAGQDRPVSITAWGGEPLIRWDFWKKLVKYCNEQAKEVGVNAIQYGGTTNGILYTPDKVEWTLKNNSLFMFSHDGVKPAHDQYRKFPNGKGSFDIVDKNLREAMKIYPKMRSRMTISVANLPYFFESVQYFVEEIGLDHIAFSPVFENNWDEKAFDLLEEQFNKTIDWQVKKYKEGATFTLKHFNDLAHKTKYHIFNPCGAGNQYMGWSVDGYCWPCHRFNKHELSTEERQESPIIIARPKGDSFEWCNKEFRKTFNFVENNPPKCTDCKLMGYGCNGNCYAVNYDITGSISEQNDVICKFNWIQENIAKKLGETCKAQGIRLPKSGWDGGAPKQKYNKPTSCVCFNMCYSEGTHKEIIHINRGTDMQCLCNQTNYQGDLKPQYRTMETINKLGKQKEKFLALSRKILATRDEEKTKDQRELEDRVLDITLQLLENKSNLKERKI